MPDYITSPDQPIPTVDRTQPGGNIQYKSVRVGAGEIVRAEIFVNRTKVGVLGPWTAKTKPGKAAVVQVRIVVNDDCLLNALEAST